MLLGLVPCYTLSRQLISVSCVHCGLPAILYHLEPGVDISLNHTSRRKEEREGKKKPTLIRIELKLVAEQYSMQPRLLNMEERGKYKPSPLFSGSLLEGLHIRLLLNGERKKKRKQN